jgi:hypothetical protein
MTTDSKKNIEKAYASKLSELLRQKWQIDGAPDEACWPDLLIGSNGVDFGLEVREIYSDEMRKGSPKRATESRNIQRIKLICKKYYEISSIPIKVNFLGNIESSKRFINCLVTATKELKDFEQVRLEPDRGSVVFVTKLPVSCVNYSHWTYVSDKVGWVSELDQKTIESKILEKAAKLPKYSENINDVRLLLVHNSLFNSGKFNIPKDNTLQTLGFKKIYILSYPDKVYVIGG